jgi:predicted secreted protein
MDHGKLILNSHNKVQTTWDIINKESGRKKKEVKTNSKIEGKQIADQQTVAETVNEYCVAIAGNVYRQSTDNLINGDNDDMDIRTHFMDQAFNRLYPSMEFKCTTTKEVDQMIKSLKTKKKQVLRDNHKDAKNKLPFYKFSSKLHT